MVPLMCIMCRSSRLIETNGCRRDTKLETTEIQKEAVRAPSAETQRLFSGLPQRHESRPATVTARYIQSMLANTLSLCAGGFWQDVTAPHLEPGQAGFEFRDGLC